MSTQSPAALPFDWRRLPWFPIAIIGALMTIVYWDVVPSMVEVWWNDDAYSHGLLVPPLAAYIAWIQRDQILEPPPRPTAAGLALTAFGCLLLVLGKLGAEFFLSRISMVVVLAGLILTFWGYQRLKRCAFVLFLLATMVPIPQIVYNKLATPLQLFSSWVASGTLEAMGIPVFRDGNIMHLAEVSLGVAEACSGLRSMSSLTVLALVIGYFLFRSASAKVLLVLLALPTAIAVNVVRIVATALMARQDPALAEGFFHSFSGWVVFLFGFAILYGIGLLIGGVERRVYPDTEPRSA